MLDDKFSFPIKTYFAAKVKQNFENININKGSAFHDLVIAPTSLLFGTVMDRINVLKRGQSILNYAVMTDEDMDRLAANYFITRAVGSQSFGLVRVYLSKRGAISLNNSVFLDQNGALYHAVTFKDISYDNILLDSTSGEWYFDELFISDDSGDNLRLFKGDTPVPRGNALFTRTEVLTTFSLGKAYETNSDLFTRIQSSITNHELVKSDAIKKILLETFPSIFSIEVVSYGDTAMNRDLVEVVLPLDTVVRSSYCKKLNVPLNGDGEVQWRDSLGNIISTPVGGWAGALYDLTGKNFRDLNVSWDGQNYRNIAVQPGFMVYFLDQDVSSLDLGGFRVRDVADAQTGPDEPEQNLLIFESAFNDLSSDSYAYKLNGSVVVNSFHVGGKVDVYIDSISNEEKSVVVSMAEGAGEVIEIPLVSYVPKTSLGEDLFEDDTYFDTPILRILEVAHVDSTDASRVIKILAPKRDFTIVRAEFRQKYSSADYDVLRITTLDDHGLNPFIGKRLRITYVTNMDFSLIQDFVDKPENKTTDILIKAPSYVLLNVRVQYSGDVDEAVLKELVSKYIIETSFNSKITASEINDLLFLSGASYVKHPIYLEALRLNPNGSYDNIVSMDEITTGQDETFYPVKELTIERI